MGRNQASPGRAVRTIGLFSPRHWFGLRPDGSIRSWLYYCLKGVGFKETVWQFVYSGQLAGLILPLEDGNKEIHVRFYCDRIEAELEVGRYYLDHFFAPRMEAKYMVLSLLALHLNGEEYDLATTHICPLCGGQREGLDTWRVRYPRFTRLALLGLALAGGLWSFGVIPSCVPVIAFGATLFVFRTLRRIPTHRRNSACVIPQAPEV